MLIPCDEQAVPLPRYLMLGISAGVHSSILETENALWIANYVSIRSISK